MQLSTTTLARPTKFFILRGDDDDFDHRAEMIRLVCNYELLLTDKTIAWLSQHNTSLDPERPRKGLFEEGPISSLTKLADLGFFLGFIGEKTRHDLRKLAKMRDWYAHDRERKQLKDDPAMYAMLTSTYTYKENKAVLDTESHYGVLVRVFWHLHECVSTGHRE